MKKQLLCGALSLTLVFSSLLGFSACSDNSELLDRIDKLEQELESTGTLLDDLQSQISQYNTLISSLENDNSASKSELQTLKTKVEALEIANSSFTEQIKQLDSASDSYAQDLATLTSNYTALSADVQNATHIDRIVVTPDTASKVDFFNEDVEPFQDVFHYNDSNAVDGITLSIHFKQNITLPFHLMYVNFSCTYNNTTTEYPSFLSKTNISSSLILSFLYKFDPISKEQADTITTSLSMTFYTFR